MSLEFGRHVDIDCLQRFHPLTENKIEFIIDLNGNDHLPLKFSRPNSTLVYGSNIGELQKMCSCGVLFYLDFLL